MSSFGASLEAVQEIIYMGGHNVPPPLCRIGLSYEISIYNQLLSLDCNGKVIEEFCFGYLWTTKYQSTYLRSSFMHEEVF